MVTPNTTRERKNPLKHNKLVPICVDKLIVSMNRVEAECAFQIRRASRFTVRQQSSTFEKKKKNEEAKTNATMSINCGSCLYYDYFCWFLCVRVLVFNALTQHIPHRSKREKTSTVFWLQWIGNNAYGGLYTIISLSFAARSNAASSL